MNKKIYIMMLSIIICMTLIIALSGTQKKKVITEVELDKIKLNHIAMSADDYNIDKVNLSNSVKNELLDSVKIYKVKTKKYNDNEINSIVKKGMNCRINNSEEQQNVKIYQLSNGGDIMYYKNSGTISYTNHNENENKSSKEIIPNNKLQKIAQQFIKKSNIFSTDELEFYRANPSITAKTIKGEEIVEYEAVYTKVPPKGIDGFDGTGPGIIVEFDCDGNVKGFVSIDKDIELTKKNYPAKDIKEIENDIVNNNNVMVYSDKEIENQLKLDSVEHVLYCDSVEEEQEYMVPHYRFKGGKKEGVDIVLPAIDNSYITIKKHKFVDK